MKRSGRHTTELLVQAERQVKRLEAENRRLKSAAASNPRLRKDLRLGTLSVFLDEYGSLVDAADPLSGRRSDRGRPSADPAHEGDVTAWARARLAGIDRDLVRVTARIQAALGTPHGERAVVDASGRCVACGKQSRRRTEVWRAEDAILP